MRKTVHFLTLLFVIPFLIINSVLLFYSSIKSEYFDLNLENEIPTIIHDNPIKLAISLVIFLLIICLIDSFIIKNNSNKIKRFLKSKYFKYIVVAYSGLISLSILLLLKSNAYMDCLSLIDAAEKFNAGDFSLLTDPTHSSYLYIYSFQIGFIAYLQLVFALFGNNIWFVQFINCIGVMFMVNALCNITDIVFKSHKISVLSKIFLIFLMPLYINIVFVYGDVLGWSFAICGTNHILNYCERSKIKDLVIACILFPIGYLLKTNIAIFIIAAVIIIALNALSKRSYSSLIFVVLIPIITLIASSSIKHIYADLAGIDEYPTGTPAVCWIAMAMIDDDNFPEGWYNGYNLTTFKESGYDYEIASDMALETIRERIEYFMNNPRKMIRFYRNKLIYAWIDPEFDSQIKMEWSTRHVTNLSPLANSLISGAGRDILFQVMNIIEFFIFSGVLIEIIHALFVFKKVLRNDNNSYLHLAYLVLPVFGGIVFHLLWETQPRYMIGYYSLLFPVAAAGIVRLANKLSKLYFNISVRSQA